MRIRSTTSSCRSRSAIARAGLAVVCSLLWPSIGQAQQDSASATGPATRATTTPAAARPGPNNTGPVRPELLVQSGSIESTHDGQVIENVDVAGRIAIAHNDVVVRNFRVTAGSRPPYAIRVARTVRGVVLEDGEVSGGGSAGIRGGGFAARRLDVHDAGNDGFKPTGDVVVEDCWIHDLGRPEKAHADGVQIVSGANFVFRRNNFDMPIGIPGRNSNATFMIGSTEGPVSNLVIEDNWLNGGNYTIYVNDPGRGNGPPSGVRITDNRFGRGFRYGPIRFYRCKVDFLRNYWEDTRWPVGF